MDSADAPRPTVLLATTNQAKRRELLALLDDLPVRWVTLSDLGTAPEVEETGQTFEENALLKARAYAAWSGLPALADDGGLEIDALGGEPGVRSRRWIDGRDAGDAELIAYTLSRLRGLPPERRGARMRVVEALVFPDRGEAVVGEGAIPGWIALEASPRLDPGFPFRSVFLYAPGRYYVDMTAEEHARLNHRRAALGPIRARLAGR